MKHSFLQAGNAARAASKRRVACLLRTANNKRKAEAAKTRGWPAKRRDEQAKRVRSSSAAHSGRGSGSASSSAVNSPKVLTKKDFRANVAHVRACGCVCVCDSYFLTYLAAGATPQAQPLPPPPTGKVRRIILCIDKNRMSSLELCAAYCCVLHPHSSLCAHLHFRVVSELIALCPQTA